jgi:hypothetical protein
MVEENSIRRAHTFVSELHAGLLNKQKTAEIFGTTDEIVNLLL